MENIIFCSALFRRHDFDLGAGYNEAMDIGFEDWDFWLNLLQNDSDVFKIPKVHFYYRIRNVSRNNQLDRMNQVQLRKKIFNNHIALYDKHIDYSEIIFELNEAKNNLSRVGNELNDLKNTYMELLNSMAYIFIRKVTKYIDLTKKIFKL